MLKKIALKALSSTTAAIFLLSLMLQAPIANAIPPSISLLIDGTPVTTESITQTVGSTTNIEIRAQGSVLVPIIEAGLDGNLDGLIDTFITGKLLERNNEGTTAIRIFPFRPLFAGQTNLIISARVGAETSVTTIQLIGEAKTIAPQPLQFMAVVNGTPLQSGASIHRRVGESALISIQASDPNAINSPPRLSASLNGDKTTFTNGPSFSGGTSSATFLFTPLQAHPNPRTLTFTATSLQTQNPAPPQTISIQLFFDPPATPTPHQNLQFEVTVDGQDITNVQNPRISRQKGQTANVTVSVSDTIHINSPPKLTAYLENKNVKFTSGPTFNGGTMQGTFLFSPLIGNDQTKQLRFTAIAHEGTTDQVITHFEITLHFAPPATINNSPRITNVTANNQTVSNNSNQTINTNTALNIIATAQNTTGTGRPTVTASINGASQSLSIADVTSTTLGTSTQQRIATLSLPNGFTTPGKKTVIITATTGTESTSYTLHYTAIQPQTGHINPLNLSVTIDGTAQANNQEVSRTVGERADIVITATDPDHSSAPPQLSYTINGGPPQTTFTIPQTANTTTGTTSATYRFQPIQSTPNPQIITFTAISHQGQLNQVSSTHSLVLKLEESQSIPHTNLTFKVGVDGTEITNNQEISREVGQSATIHIRVKDVEHNSSPPELSYTLGNGAPQTAFETGPTSNTSTGETSATFLFRPLQADPNPRNLILTATSHKGESNETTQTFTITLRFTNPTPPPPASGNITIQVVNAPTEIDTFNWEFSSSENPDSHFQQFRFTPTFTSLTIPNNPNNLAYTVELKSAIPSGFTISEGRSQVIPSGSTQTNPTITFTFVADTVIPPPPPPPPPASAPEFIKIIHNGIDLKAQTNPTILVSQDTPLTIHAVAQNPQSQGRPTITATLDAVDVSINLSDTDIDNRTALENFQRRATFTRPTGFSTSGTIELVFTTTNTNGSEEFRVPIQINSPVTLEALDETNPPGTAITDGQTLSLLTSRQLPSLKFIATDRDGTTRPVISMTTDIPGTPTLTLLNPVENFRQVATLFATAQTIATPGNYTINLSSTDGIQPTPTTFTINFTVTNPAGTPGNNAPELELRNIDDTATIDPPTFSIEPGNELAFVLKGTDIDTSQILSITSTTLPTGATLTTTDAVSPLTANFSWTPTAAQIGSETITFTLTDDAGGVDTITVTITIEAPGIVAINNENLLELTFTDGTTVPGTMALETGDALSVLTKILQTARPTTTVVFTASDNTAIPQSSYNASINSFNNTFSTTGTFTISFTATNSANNETDTDTVTITITNPVVTTPPPNNGGGTPPPSSPGGGAAVTNNSGGRGGGQPIRKRGEPQRSRVSMLKKEITKQQREGTPIADHCQFTDIQNYSAATQSKIVSLCNLGIISGYKNATFQGRRDMNRAEFTKILVTFGYDTETLEAMKRFLTLNRYATFPDVKYNYWYAKYVGVALQNEQIHGYPSGAFDPNKNINLAEALKILVGIAATDNAHVQETFKKQTATPLDPWFAQYDKTAIALNVLKGNPDTILAGNIYDPTLQRGYDLSLMLKRQQSVEIIYDIIMAAE